MDSAGSPAPFRLTGSPGFADWLGEVGAVVAFTTYQSGKLFLVGRRADGGLAATERTFTRAMGLWTDGQTLWLAAADQLWKLVNVLPPGRTDDGYDRLFVPRLAHATGDLDAHDVSADAAGGVVFVNTRFSCLAGLSPTHSFREVWRPPFVSALAPEDRCHLNGLAVRDGRPAFVTVAARTDTPEGWRDQRVAGGCVLAVDSGEVVAAGLSMPHSPRWHDGRLWALDSGNGLLGSVDLTAGRFEPVALCPGYARGLAFAGRFAVVGLSLPRRGGTFGGLPLDAGLATRGLAPECGLAVVDLPAGRIAHRLAVEGVVTELYDVAVLPRTVRAGLVGVKAGEAGFTVTADGHPGVIWRGRPTRAPR